MWPKNITNLDKGIYRTINGNSDELIGIGRCIKAGFNCSRVDITNAKYDAVIDIENIMLRVQIKGTSTNTVSFIGGERSGAQIDKSVKKRNYVYTKNDCDLIMVVNSNNGECYIIPIEDISKLGKTVSLSKLELYKENWDSLKSMVS